MINLYYYHHHLYTVLKITYLKQAMLLVQTMRQLFCNYSHGTIIAAATSTTRNFTLNSFKVYLTIITQF